LAFSQARVEEGMRRASRSIAEEKTIADALRTGRYRLASAPTTTPSLDADVLLRHALGIDRATFFARLADPIPATALERYRTLLAERARGIPVAYLTGEREFMGLSFAVSAATLIPRPETEILVEWAIAWLYERERAIVVDVGTGTGAVALSIASALDPAWAGRVVASEVSTDALLIAARNRAHLGLSERVALVRGSLLEWLGRPIDLLLANLPYLRPDQIEDNPELAAEPRLALDGGADGLALIEPLLLDAPRVLAPGGAVGIEIDPSQRSEVVRLAKRAFPGSTVSVLHDLAGWERHVVVETAAASDGP
jgi:release factor glutamine methyltransferase